MKYLKKFNENKSDILYEEISERDYVNITNRHGEHIEFSPDFESTLLKQAGVKDVTSWSIY